MEKNQQDKKRRRGWKNDGITDKERGRKGGRNGYKKRISSLWEKMKAKEGKQARERSRRMVSKKANI